MLYPPFPSTTPTYYDGMFRVFFVLPANSTSLSVWDGDFDRGKFDATDTDTDDPDTPNEAAPIWATAGTVAEGAAASSPPDDADPADLGLYDQRSPFIRYDLFFPDAQAYADDKSIGDLGMGTIPRFDRPVRPCADGRYDHDDSFRNV